MIDSKTRMAAVIGNPIEHSLSPLIHNAGIREKNLNFIYLAFKITNVKDSIIAMRELGIVGYSVTIPHKIEVMNYLDEVEVKAKLIGAVNTVVNKNGKLVGYNSDCTGAMNALKEKTQISGKRVYILGAGGVARAIVAGLVEEGAKVKIFDILAQKAVDLARDFNCSSGQLGEVDSNCDILINASPIGMHPKVDEMAVSENVLKKEMVVFDVVYNPLQTKLLKTAKNKGCVIVEGVEMFLGQAYVQFEMFFGEKAPKEIMRKVLLEELTKKQK